MSFPVTRYGLPQVIVYPVLILALMAALFIFVPWAGALVAAEILLFFVFVWTLMFFRDPPRVIPLNPHVLLSPADGAITEISCVDTPDLGKALRIGIFLSIFNVHLNRAPCALRVESVVYKKGRFKNALSAESGAVNESNEILATRLAAPGERLLIRQVSGAIARRIVCKAEPGQQLEQGAPFGMIKFGSRTELYLPVGKGYDVVVKIGDKVNAGLTPLVMYTSC